MYLYYFKFNQVQVKNENKKKEFGKELYLHLKVFKNVMYFNFMWKINPVLDCFRSRDLYIE